VGVIVVVLLTLLVESLLSLQIEIVLPETSGQEGLIGGERFALTS